MSRRALAGVIGAVVVVVVVVVAVTVLGGDDTDAPEVADEPDATDHEAEPDDPGAAEPEQADEEPADEDAEPADDPDGDAADDAAFVIETVADGLDQAWGLAFLPGGPQLLVTQLPGILSVVDTETGEVTDIDGVPEVFVRDQGGLLDVAVHPEWPESDWIYLTYSAAGEGRATSTHLARARLDLDAEQLQDLDVLFAAEPFLEGRPQHYGSRVVFGPDDHLYVTVGDRAHKDFDDHPSQDPSNHLGTTVRLTTDGAVPDDNPFVDDPDVADEIFTYGHRNVQGMTVHPETGEIWQSEHGEQDGDEINVLEPGGNYGWPETHTGCEYGTETPLGEHPEEREDVVDPLFYWECATGGFPPAGMTFYAGDELPAWEGDLFVASLATRELARFTVQDGEVEEAERLLGDEAWRLRDVEVGPHDGALYVAIDAGDAPLVRLVGGAEE